MIFQPGFGVIEAPPRVRDWIAGAVSGIQYQEVVPSGQWDEWLVEKELQYGINFDTYNCTGFATLNSIEIQELQQTGKESNYSDRFVGALSGLTERGNYITAPPEAIRRYGLCKETTWPFPRLDPNFTRADYLAQPSNEAMNEGRLWLNKWKLRYELLIDTTPQTLMHHLKQAPLTGVSPVCPGWGYDDIIKACSVDNGHAYTIYGYKENEYWKIQDHYDKYLKKLAWNYQFRVVVKNLLIPNNPYNMSPEAEKYLKENNKKFVLAIPSGRNAYIKNMEAMEINTADRGALAAIAYIRENGGGGSVPDSLYDQFPKRPF